MDKYEYQIEQLAKRVRKLEEESLPDGLSEEVKALMDDLELVPAIGSDKSQKLSGKIIAAILEEYGYSCKMGEDFVMIETELGKLEVSFRQMPVITITNGYVLNESEEGMRSLKRAAADITMYWDMVKAVVDPEGEHLMIFIDARHEEVVSFRQSVRYYIEQIISATKDFKERYHNYERDRWVAGLKLSPKQLAS
jgi:hypothetical protein